MQTVACGTCVALELLLFSSVGLLALKAFIKILCIVGILTTTILLPLLPTDLTFDIMFFCGMIGRAKRQKREKRPLKKDVISVVN